MATQLRFFPCKKKKKSADGSSRGLGLFACKNFKEESDFFMFCAWEREKNRFHGWYFLQLRRGYWAHSGSKTAAVIACGLPEAARRRW